MKQIVRCGILAVTFLSGHNLKSEEILKISCADLEQKLQLSTLKKETIFVINVLPKAICADCKIPGSLNIPLDKLEKKVQKWPKSREIIVHCAGLNCPLGGYACTILQNMGFGNIILFDGGIRTWKLNNLPTIGRCRAGYLKG